MQRNKKKLRKIRRHNHTVASQTKVKPIKLPEEPNTLNLDEAMTHQTKPLPPISKVNWNPVTDKAGPTNITRRSASPTTTQPVSEETDKAPTVCVHLPCPALSLFFQLY